MKRGFRFILTDVLDVLYPRSCVHCGGAAPQALDYFCWDCLSDIPKIEAPFCYCCGDPVAGSVEHSYSCFLCSRNQPAFDFSRSAVRYEGAAGTALRALKYHHAVWLVHDLMTLLYACTCAEYPHVVFDAVCAVPLFPSRRRERGFNQSALLAASLAKKMRIPFGARWVRRIRATPTQTGLTAPQRTANVCGAFRKGLFARFDGKRILLIDDVMTTGATVNACASALKEGGAESVHVMTVARG